jgi:hypothetical protein
MKEARSVNESPLEAGKSHNGTLISVIFTTISETLIIFHDLFVEINHGKARETNLQTLSISLPIAFHPGSCVDILIGSNSRNKSEAVRRLQGDFVIGSNFLISLKVSAQIVIKFIRFVSFSD